MLSLKFGLDELLSDSRSPNENDFTFWLIFGLSPNLKLSESLSKRLIWKVKWSIVYDTGQTHSMQCDAMQNSTHLCVVPKGR